MSARVLVVDDEPQILRGLRVVLRSAGYDVTTAQTKAEALDAVSVRPPDAMLLDLVLPDGSGVDVCQEVRRWSALPIIVLSAVGDEREKVRALDDGASCLFSQAGIAGQLRPAAHPRVVAGAQHRYSAHVRNPAKMSARPGV